MTGLSVEDHAYCSRVAASMVRKAKDRPWMEQMERTNKRIYLAHRMPYPKPISREEEAEMCLRRIQQYVRLNPTG